jgi:hypothetical protein
MRGARLTQRSPGTGVIRHAQKGRPGWIAFAPQVGGDRSGRGERIGHFDTYRAAEKALAEFIAGKKVA